MYYSPAPGALSPPGRIRNLLLTLWWFLFPIKLLINLFDALWYADVLHGNKLRQFSQIKDVSNLLTEF